MNTIEIRLAKKEDAKFIALLGRTTFTETFGHFFRANVVDSTLKSFVFQITGTVEKIDAFAELMEPLGLKEIARTGIAAISRGE